MQINSALIESLLYEEESTTLDFKRDQYPFVGKDDRTKCELLKDILAFANSWRREDAYIVIGVEEVQGGRSNVIGVTSHLEDASLQQFINSKTQKPLNFSYTAFEYEGKQIGIIYIPIQERPIYLLKDFGRLKKGVVYIRRGSSTDDAAPDEIAKMGQADLGMNSLIPDLDFGWGNSEKRTTLSRNIEVTSTNLIIPNQHEIPKYGVTYTPIGNGMFVPQESFLKNEQYYRELALFKQKMAFYGDGINFVITNSGDALAHDVKVEIQCPQSSSILFAENSDMPDPPEKEDSLIFSPHSSMYRNNNIDTDIKVSKNEDYWYITATFPKVQPKQTVWSKDYIFIGASVKSEQSLIATVYSDNMPNPQQIDLSLQVTVEQVELDLQEFVDEKYL